jgi:hypothetical protein
MRFEDSREFAAGLDRDVFECVERMREALDT